MNDRRFTELLNLYLDHHIGADEAAELETEVARNPGRRRVYDQYCRLQRGCSLLGERERSAAPAADAFTRALRDAERKIAAPRRAAWWSSSYAGVFGASAMAACVAIVVVVQTRTPSTALSDDGLIATASEAVPAIEPVARLASAPVAAQAEGVRASLAQFELHSMLAASGFGVARNLREAEIAANDREVLEWMQRVEQSSLRPVVVDDQAFVGVPALHQDNRVFRSRHDIQGNAEFTAFQFQR